MKKLMLPLLLVSSLANAHGHWPQKISEYSMDQVFEVKFKLSNHFKTKTCYNIEINGEIFTPQRTCLNHLQSKNISVWVHTKPDVKTKNVVCSISDSKDKMKTRMCTKVTTLYPKSYLVN